MEEVVFCPFCGQVVNKTYRYCPFCGTEMRKSPPSFEEVIEASLCEVEKKLLPDTVRRLEHMESVLGDLEIELEEFLSTKS